MSSYISLVVTILRKRSFLRAKAERAMMACAVEKFGLTGSPELLFHSWLSQSSLEKEFICPMNVQKQLLFCSFFLWRWMTFPISSAKHIEASLPLGSINPYNKSSTFSKSPAVSYAEVPGVSGILSGTRQKQFLMSTSYFLQMRMERQQVMILLKEAISISLAQLKAAMGWFYSTSQTQNILALSIFALFSSLIVGSFAMPSLILVQCQTPFCQYARNPFLNRFYMLDFSQNLYTDRAWFNLEGEQLSGFLWLGDSQSCSTLSQSCEGLRLLLILGMLILFFCCVFSSGLSLGGQLIFVLVIVQSSGFLFLRILLSYPHLKSMRSMTVLFSCFFLGCSLPPL